MRLVLLLLLHSQMDRTNVHPQHSPRLVSLTFTRPFWAMAPRTSRANSTPFLCGLLKQEELRSVEVSNRNPPPSYYSPRRPGAICPDASRLVGRSLEPIFGSPQQPSVRVLLVVVRATCQVRFTLRATWSLAKTGAAIQTTVDLTADVSYDLLHVRLRL